MCSMCAAERVQEQLAIVDVMFNQGREMSFEQKQAALEWFVSLNEDDQLLLVCFTSKRVRRVDHAAEAS